MSALNNRHWIEQDGTPITGRTPPELRVYGPEMTGDQQAQVRHIYKLFTDVCLVAIGEYQVRRRVLADGTRVRCTSFQGRDVVEVWTQASENDEFLPGGFVCRPQDDFGNAKLYWGKPVTALNAPLGTEFGEDPQVFLKTKVDKKTSIAESAFKVVRFVSDQYGTLDWQGPDGLVVSWDAEDLGDVSFTASGTPVNSASNDRYFAGSVYDSEIKKATVRRYNSHGSGNKVFSKFAELEQYSAKVCGAAYFGKTLVAVITADGPLITQQLYSFVVKQGDTEHVIGTYETPVNHTTTQCWFFNRTGDKARSVVISANAGFVVEATIAKDDFSPVGLSASVSVVSSTSGEGFWDGSGSSPPLLCAQTSSVSAAITSENTIPHPTIAGSSLLMSRTASFSVSTGFSTDIRRSYDSPVFAADFIGDEPIELFVRRRAKIYDVSGSAYYSCVGTMHTKPREGTSPLVWVDYIETYSNSASATSTSKVFSALVLRENGVESEIDVGGNGIYRTEIRSFGGGSKITTLEPPQESIDNQSYTLNASQNSTAEFAPNFSKKVLDFDLRSKAFCVLMSGPPNEVSGSNNQRLSGKYYRTVYGQNRPPVVWTNDTAYFPAAPLQVMTEGKNGLLAAETVFEEEGFSGTSAAQPINNFFVNLPSGYTFLNEHMAGLIFNPLISDQTLFTFYAERVEQLRNSLFPTNVPHLYSAAVRTYYGQVCSTGIIGDSTDQPNGHPELFFAHISAQDESDATKLLEIDSQERPWLHKIGVI